jgi:hypothetical protein
MKKTTINENINQLKRISSKMPKTINEAITFEDDGEDVMNGGDVADDEMIDEPQPEEPQDNGMDVMAFVDDIRKKSLKGMAQLADNPDDERYQLLKKIWQICDKKPEQQTAFSNPNNQQGNMQGNPQQLNGGGQRI